MDISLKTPNIQWTSPLRRSHRCWTACYIGSNRGPPAAQIRLRSLPIHFYSGSWLRTLGFCCCHCPPLPALPLIDVDHSHVPAACQHFHYPFIIVLPLLTHNTLYNKITTSPYSRINGFHQTINTISPLLISSYNFPFGNLFLFWTISFSLPNSD